MHPKQNRVTLLLSDLPWKKQFAFALLILERMFPVLVYFSEETGFEPSIYLKGRASAWDALRDSKLKNELVLRSLSDACTKNAPDTESYSNELASHALNAALSTANILSFAADHKLDHIFDVMELARDSVDLYLQSLDPSPISESGTEQLDRHPLLQREYERQAEDLRFVSALPEKISEETLSKLRGRAQAQTPLLPITISARSKTK
jgi:uncharacterized protein YjaG (DUF416 family)